MKSADEFFADIEKYRTLSEMKEYFNIKKNLVLNDDNFVKIARLKIGRFKKFLEEYYPLMLFMNTRFCEEESMASLVIGNQGYDAIIKSANGEKKVEFTIYEDGKFEYIDAIKLNETGIGNLRFSDANSLDDRALGYLDKVLENIEKKRMKDYSGVELVILVNTFGYFDVYNNSAVEFRNQLLDILRDKEFIADSVYVIFGTEQIKNIDKYTYKID